MTDLPEGAVVELRVEAHTSGRGERLLSIQARDHEGTVLLAVVNGDAVVLDPRLLEDLKKAFSGHITRMVALVTGEPEEKVALGAVSGDENEN